MQKKIFQGAAARKQFCVL